MADIAIAKIFHQQDADSIADDHNLTLVQVYAALAYYYEHKAAIDARSSPGAGDEGKANWQPPLAFIWMRI